MLNKELPNLYYTEKPIYTITGFTTEFLLKTCLYSKCSQNVNNDEKMTQIFILVYIWGMKMFSMPF